MFRLMCMANYQILLMVLDYFYFAEIGILDIVFEDHVIHIQTVDSALQDEVNCVWVLFLLVNNVGSFGLHRLHHQNSLRDEHLVLIFKKYLILHISKHLFRDLSIYLTCCLILLGSWL